MGQIFNFGAMSHVIIFSSHLTWYSDSLKRSAVSLEQYHKTGNSRGVQKKKELYKTEVFWFDSETPITLTSHQCK